MYKTPKKFPYEVEARRIQQDRCPGCGAILLPLDSSTPVQIRRCSQHPTCPVAIAASDYHRVEGYCKLIAPARPASSYDKPVEAT